MTATLVQPAPRLHEIQWLYRRLWVFAVTIGNLALLALIVVALGLWGVDGRAAAALADLALGLIALNALIGLLYIVGPTAYELAQLVASARIDIAAVRVGGQS